MNNYANFTGLYIDNSVTLFLSVSVTVIWILSVSVVQSV